MGQAARPHAGVLDREAADRLIEGHVRVAAAEQGYHVFAQCLIGAGGLARGFHDCAAEEPAFWTLAGAR
jgi:hypothetical protein